MSEATNTQAKWSYPKPWPALHASHKAPRPDSQGQLIGTTRLLSGLFVATFFKDMRGGAKWRMALKKQGMNLKGLTIGEENFGPTLTRTSDGKVYLVDGNRSVIIRLEGFDFLRHIAPIEIKLTPTPIEECQTWTLAQEIERQKDGENKPLAIPLNSVREIDGDLQDWQNAEWAQIDSRGVKAYFNTNSKPYDVRAALAISGDYLFTASKTGNVKLLENSNEMPLAPFQTGGALDLMLGPDGDRKSPVEGDLQFLITLKDQKPRALLYRAIVPGTPDSEKVPFSSTWSTIPFDEILDVSEQVKLAAKEGDYEVSIPLKSLGIEPSDGKQIRGDLGTLWGAKGETNARTYWHNKATGIIADVPSEAQLTPELWSRFQFKN